MYIIYVKETAEDLNCEYLASKHLGECFLKFFF